MFKENTPMIILDQRNKPLKPQYPVHTKHSY